MSGSTWYLECVIWALELFGWLFLPYHLYYTVHRSTQSVNLLLSVCLSSCCYVSAYQSASFGRDRVTRRWLVRSEWQGCEACSVESVLVGWLLCWRGLCVLIRVPMPPGKSWIFFLENSRTWKVLENHFGPGKSWKLKLMVLESPGKISLKVMHFSSGSNGKQAAIVLLPVST